MKVIPIRLKPNADLRKSLINFAVEQKVQAGFVLTAIGSLKQAAIRFANQDNSKVLNEKFEILSLNGTLAATGIHVHISIADSNGKVIGGHLSDGCIVYTTAEIVIGIAENFSFYRSFDEETGFNELEVVTVV
ncbi:putative DNA-binding protein with PD1-like DNA-binding motif [Rivularia sp. PCC 7116]|uniref:PPC domain-containing DNA-binding protein n=1 Tax=Rivularia sp. PCC 7116 TaxID=373994 RepID=UPI00029ED0DE|nr:PPC domain-containing DNA-binding protein [Rivularia sp. PCC 7116]AFY56178.1 putative DNA-binding protein with PD1-like DNA-binding motif [Rivularia sp. PCC 7116]